MNAPLPPDEEKRLAALRRYEILDTSPELAYDRITSMAARLFSTPIALVTLLDEHRQWFKSACGLDVKETPRDIAFCAHAILNRGVMVVPDARDDERFAANPLVANLPAIRFYAGAPLLSPDGFALGTLCVIDTVERKSLTEPEMATLTDLAALVVDEMEFRFTAKSLLEANQHLERKASEDGLTALANRACFEQRLRETLSECEPTGGRFALLYLDLDRFKPVNDRLGHAAGDALLQQAGARLRETLPSNGTLARIGGDEFLALLPHAESEDAERLALKMCHSLAAPFVIDGCEITVSVSVGIAIYPDDAVQAVGLVRQADEAMYEAKRQGGDCYRRAQSSSPVRA